MRPPPVNSVGTREARRVRAPEPFGERCIWGAMDLYGVRLVGIDPQTGNKVLFTLVLVAFFVALRWLLGGVVRWTSSPRTLRLRFWVQQFASLFTGAILLLGLVSIWFNNSQELATVLGLFTAGLAFALQKVITALAGYFVILRGNMFQVGDRIVIAQVRGDVIGVGFMQTTIMEIGLAGAGASADVWVEGRQFTGRIVTVSNATIFDHAVYNYSRDFPLIWEEMHIPIKYTADHARAERILLDCAERHTADLQRRGEHGVQVMLGRYGMPEADLQPRVFFRLTDNWVELSMRFVAPTHGSRGMKDAMSREILAAFAAAGIDVASATSEIVGLPPLRVQLDGAKA